MKTLCIFLILGAVFLQPTRSQSPQDAIDQSKVTWRDYRLGMVKMSTESDGTTFIVGVAPESDGADQAIVQVYYYQKVRGVKDEVLLESFCMVPLADHRGAKCQPIKVPPEKIDHIQVMMLNRVDEQNFDLKKIRPIAEMKNQKTKTE